jgi:hypothetical protein
MIALANHYITAKFIQITVFTLLIYKYISNILNIFSLFDGSSTRVVPSVRTVNFKAVASQVRGYSTTVSNNMHHPQ